MIAEAKKQGIPEAWITAAQIPVYKNGDGIGRVASAAPEYRTLPIVWYIQPLSPIQWRSKQLIAAPHHPSVKDLRIPIQYLANLSPPQKP